jgi:hypothetical protein
MDGSILTASGTWHLATEAELTDQRKSGQERTHDLRFSRLLDSIARQINQGVNRIIFEDVLFVRSQDQAQLWASLRSAIWATAHNCPIVVHGVATATLKKFATGNGGATKIDMALALAAAEPNLYLLNPDQTLRRPEGSVVDDNEVDAIWLARFTMSVDRGERQFLSVHDRKVIAKAERRTRKAAAKALKKSRAEFLKAGARARKRAVHESLKAAGKCCGVFRKPASRNRACCPKCGRTIKLVIPMVAAVGTPQPGDADRPAFSPIPSAPNDSHPVKVPSVPAVPILSVPIVPRSDVSGQSAGTTEVRDERGQNSGPKPPAPAVSGRNGGRDPFGILRQAAASGGRPGPGQEGE